MTTDITPSIFSNLSKIDCPYLIVDVIEKAIKKKVEIPPQIQKILNKKSKKTSIESYQDLKQYLIDHAV